MVVKEAIKVFVVVANKRMEQKLLEAVPGFLAIAVFEETGQGAYRCAELLL